MNPSQWITILGIACTVLVTVTTWGFLTGKFSGGVEEKAQRLADELREYKAETTRRFEEAGHETSKAWSYVQGLESRLIREFVNRDLVDMRFGELRRELDQFRAELERFKDVCNRRHS